MPVLISAEAAASEIVKCLRAGKFEIDFPRRFHQHDDFLRMLPYRWCFALIHKSTGL